MDTAKINRAKEQEHIFNVNHKDYEKKRIEAMALRPLDKNYGNRFFAIDTRETANHLCAGCGEPIVNGGIIIFGIPYHDECYVSAK